ncbi:sperm-associated antigen 17, partial [Brachionus plicatilis]
KKSVKIEQIPAAPSPTQLQAQQSVQQAEEPKTAKKSTKKGKKGEITPEPKKEEKKPEELAPPPEVVEIKEELPKISVLPWTQLNVSAPSGLSCTFLPETYAGVSPVEDNQAHKLVVKQRYAQKCTAKAGEHFKNFNQNVLQEKSRLIKSDGTVIKFYVDDSFEVLYPNGTIYRKVTETIEESDLETLETHENKSKSKKKDTIKSDEIPVPHIETHTVTKYLVTTQSGNEYLINKEDNSFKLERFYRNIKSNDSQTNEVMVTREDNLRIVNRPDGSSLVDFSDGTRITSFYVEQNGHPKEKYVKIECPGYATTIFNTITSECTLAIGTNGTIVCCDPAKVNYSVMHGNGEIIDVNKDASVYVTIKNGALMAKNKFCFRQDADVILEHEDEMGNRFKVNKSGKNSIFNVNSKGEIKPLKIYNKHSPRFFIIHKDSSGTELLRSEDVSEYLADVEVDPMTAIIRDNVQGYPNIMGTTVLRPLRNCLTDEWTNEYDEKEIIPPGLRSRNLNNFPPNPEVKVNGPSFGTNAGKSLAVDLNQNRRVKNPPITIAKRMEYRQLIEYQKLSEPTKTKLINGLKNYMIYIAQRAENHRLLLTYDPKSEADKISLSKILQISRADHLLNADVTNMYKKALSKNKAENIGMDLKSLNNLMKKPKLSDKKNKTEKELQMEKANREAWRKSFVPSYFASEWGQNFLNKLANKENSFFKTSSENDFIQESKESNEASMAEFKQTKTETKDKTKIYYPAMSYLETEFSSEKKTNTNNGSAPYQRYQPQFKFIDKLDAKKLPSSIKTARPNAVPNSLFLSNEEPVRRKVNNSIINASHLNGRSLDKRRGLEVYPKEIKFGILREGFTYVCDFELVNVGIDACRFKIKQPPPETGIKVMFKPGPIAAGMNRDLNIVLLAIFTLSDQDISEQVYPKVRSLVHELEITTETDLLKVPIQAEIASIEEFRNMFRGNLDAGKEKNVRILSVRPGSTKEVLTKPLSLKNNNIDQEKKIGQMS